MTKMCIVAQLINVFLFPQATEAKQIIDTYLRQLEKVTVSRVIVIAQSRLNGLKSLAKLFNLVVFQSVSIFSILNHSCFFMLCYNLFGVFLSL